MNFLKFEDYIPIYQNILQQEWTTLFENVKDEKDGIHHDLFTFCCITDTDRIEECLRSFNWGFSPDSFGKSYFEKVSRNTGNGIFEEEIFFVSGETKDRFEYLVAYRSFNKKYPVQLDINSKLIWYRNLARQGDNYLDPITDEIFIKVYDNKIQVLTRYLRDFLCAYNKVCIIVFDHRRFGSISGNVENEHDTLTDRNYVISRSINSYRYKNNNISGSVLGKVIIEPYKQSQHPSLKVLVEEEIYEEFIYDIDTDTGNPLKFTCNEDMLANFFGANPDAPQFLTPIYFNKSVLNKYKTDTSNYKIDDGLIRHLGEWDLPFTINEVDKVIVWLGDLGRIPNIEQQYWKTENIPPQGDIEENFWKQQIEAVFVDKILPEKWLFSLIQQLNEAALKKYNAPLFNPLSETDKSIESAFMTPVKNNVDEYKEFLLQLCKILTESIDSSLIKTHLTKDEIKDEQGKTLGQIKQLELLFVKLNIKNGNNLILMLKKIHNSRNKLAGHRASLKEYNKIWSRSDDYVPDWIADAKILLNSVNDSIVDLMEELIR